MQSVSILTSDPNKSLVLSLLHVAYLPNLDDTYAVRQ
jgi:hypothetical protein